MRTFRTVCVTMLMVAGLGVYAEPQPVVLRSGSGVEALFAPSAGNAGWRWTGLRDAVTGTAWAVDDKGPGVRLENEIIYAALETSTVEQTDATIALTSTFPDLGISARREFAFRNDGRTLSITTSLKSFGNPVNLKEVRLLDITIPNEALRLNGPAWVSCPVFGARVFAGLEHPSAFVHAEGAACAIGQPVYAAIGGEAMAFPAAVVGFSSADDLDAAGSEPEALRRTFLRYLETVRVKPADMHIHYNDWWTAPVPSSEAFVLGNIAALKKGLFDTTGFFFDSYAMDMGWSDPKTVWGIDTVHFPEGFSRVRSALDAVGARPGLWVSPSSCYPPALDNPWLESAGYEVIHREDGGLFACLGIGGRYQQAFQDAVVRYAREAHFAHVKFDGYVPLCNAENHGHPKGEASAKFLVDGLASVFDALRAQDPSIVLEPTCFGYNLSPWWLMHTPFVIGPFGDDCPRGKCPCPEWTEALITGRDIKNLEGRGAFLMPSSALQCFDIIVQNPGDFQNLAVMAIGRGRWFLSCYINPVFMDEPEWRFFAELITWARAHRVSLQEPLPIGGNPAKREAYGYAFQGAEQAYYCIRNPWIKESALSISLPHGATGIWELRALYPRREVIARMDAGAGTALEMALGPYETRFIEAVPVQTPPMEMAPVTGPDVVWTAAAEPQIKRVPGGNASAANAIFSCEGQLAVTGAASSEICVLCEGNMPLPQTCHVLINGYTTPVTVSKSEGAFSATGAPVDENWVWFTAPVPAGGCRLNVQVGMDVSAGTPSFSVFVRGSQSTAASPAPFGDGPAFPLFKPELRSWSRPLAENLAYLP